MRSSFRVWSIFGGMTLAAGLVGCEAAKEAPSVGVPQSPAPVVKTAPVVGEMKPAEVKPEPSKPAPAEAKPVAAPAPADAKLPPIEAPKTAEKKDVPKAK